jgi:hypothetical protein
MHLSDDGRYQYIDLPSTVAKGGVDPMGNPDIYLTVSAEPILHAGKQVWSNPILDIDTALQLAGIREVQENPASMRCSYYRGNQRLDPFDAHLAIYREIFWQEVAEKNRSGVFITGTWIGKPELSINMRAWFNENSHLAPVGIDFETCIVRCYNTTSGQIERYRFDVIGQVYRIVEVAPERPEKPRVPADTTEGVDAELFIPLRTRVHVERETLDTMREHGCGITGQGRLFFAGSKESFDLKGSEDGANELVNISLSQEPLGVRVEFTEFDDDNGVVVIDYNGKIVP